MSKWKVEVTQRHVYEFDDEKLIAAFPDEHAEFVLDETLATTDEKDAQWLTETNDEWVKEALHTLGTDILHDPELFTESEPAELELDYWKDGKRP